MAVTRPVPTIPQWVWPSLPLGAADSVTQLAQTLNARFQQLNQTLVFLLQAVNGPIANVTTVTATYTVRPSDSTLRVDATAANLTVTVPLSSSNPGRKLIFTRVDATGHTATVACTGADTYKGAGTFTLAQYVPQEIQADGGSTYLPI